MHPSSHTELWLTFFLKKSVLAHHFNIFVSSVRSKKKFKNPFSIKITGLNSLKISKSLSFSNFFEPKLFYLSFQPTQIIIFYPSYYFATGPFVTLLLLCHCSLGPAPRPFLTRPAPKKKDENKKVLGYIRKILLHVFV